MVAGSKAGVFVRSFTNDNKNTFSTLTVFEGVSDLIHTYTPYAIGRLSCESSAPVVAYLRGFSILRGVQIMADNDPPGLVGAGKLAAEIKDKLSLKVRVYVPRVKDWRSHVEAGYGWDDLRVL
jgi:hypothetical protein